MILFWGERREGMSADTKYMQRLVSWQGGCREVSQRRNDNLVSLFSVPRVKLGILYSSGHVKRQTCRDEIEQGQNTGDNQNCQHIDLGTNGLVIIAKD